VSDTERLDTLANNRLKRLLSPVSVLQESGVYYQQLKQTFESKAAATEGVGHFVSKLICKRIHSRCKPGQQLNGSSLSLDREQVQR
jgi:hypothetical protein